MGLVPYVLTPALHTGLLFLCLVPSTVQSSIAFTSLARGNVAAAICAGSFSSLVGIVVTPLLAGLVLHGDGGGFSADSLLSIVGQLLLPFVAGQLLRRWISGFLLRHKKVLGYVDRGSILLVVYTAFSAGMVQGIWHQVSTLRLLCLLGVEAVLLAVMLTVTSYGSKRLGFARADRIAITFAGFQEEPGGRSADGQRALRRAGRADGAAADAVPPDAVDGVRGPGQAVRGSGACGDGRRRGKRGRGGGRGRCGGERSAGVRPARRGGVRAGHGFADRLAQFFAPPRTRSSGSPSTSGPFAGALALRTPDSSASLRARR